MPTKNIILLISILSVLLLALAGFLFVRNTNQTQTKIPSPSPVLTTPTPTPVSKPVPVTISTVEGTIISLTNSSITITSDGKTKTFSISGTKDFQKVTSGTVAGGDAKTIPSSASELNTGQEVLIIHNIGSSNAKSIYIIK